MCDYAYSKRCCFVEGGKRVRQDCGGRLVHCIGRWSVHFGDFRGTRHDITPTLPQKNMSNRHQMLKDARKAGSAHTNKDQLKKFVARPKTLDHNMHDDFVHDPPKVWVSCSLRHCRLNFPRTSSRAAPGPTRAPSGLLRVRCQVRSWAESSVRIWRVN